MHIKITTPSQETFFELSFVKTFLRITHDEDDELLAHIMTTAVEWVERELEKTLLTKEIYVAHDNNRFLIPCGPVQSVTSVKRKGATLEEGKDYTLTPRGDSFVIETPFRWKSAKLEIEFKAGFGDTAQEVPPTLKNAVLGTIGYLYENRGRINEKELYEQATPWLHSHRCYSLV